MSIHIFSVKALRVYVSVLPTLSTTVEMSVCFVKFFDNKLPLDGEIRNIEKAVVLDKHSCRTNATIGDTVLVPYGRYRLKAKIVCQNMDVGLPPSVTTTSVDGPTTNVSTAVDAIRRSNRKRCPSKKKIDSIVDTCKENYYYFYYYYYYYYYYEII